jgi:hypothetical protein
VHSDNSAASKIADMVGDVSVQLSKLVKDIEALQRMSTNVIDIKYL